MARISENAKAVAKRIHCLRDFLELLEENGQFIRWPEAVMPEPDIRKVAVASGRDSMGAPAIMFDKIRGYEGKKMVLGVHGSFTNIALLLGYPRGTSIKELFYELIQRWGSDKPLLEHIEPEDAPVNEPAAYALYDPDFTLLDAILEESRDRLLDDGKLLLAYGGKVAILRILETADDLGWQAEIVDKRELTDLPDVFLPGMLLVLTPDTE